MAMAIKMAIQVIKSNSQKNETKTIAKPSDQNNQPLDTHKQQLQYEQE